MRPRPAQLRPSPGRLRRKRAPEHSHNAPRGGHRRSVSAARPPRAHSLPATRARAQPPSRIGGAGGRGAAAAQHLTRRPSIDERSALAAAGHALCWPACCSLPGPTPQRRGAPSTAPLVVGGPRLLAQDIRRGAAPAPTRGPRHSLFKTRAPPRPAPPRPAPPRPALAPRGPALAAAPCPPLARRAGAVPAIAPPATRARECAPVAAASPASAAPAIAPPAAYDARPSGPQGAGTPACWGSSTEAQRRPFPGARAGTCRAVGARPPLCPLPLLARPTPSPALRPSS
jgi:hypothetical protein